jgi:ADP-heptose:LPS heptosyltransferase
MVKDVFGLNTDPVGLTYEVTVNREAKDRVDRFLAIKGLQRRESPSRNTIYMVLNFAAVDEVRRMSVDQTVELIRLLSRIRPERPVIIFPPGDRSTLDEILRRSDAALPVVYPDDGTATLLEIASLIAGAQYVITPDTSIIHFASAFKIPLFALYTPTAARNHQWLPYGVFYRSVRAQLGSGVSSIPFNQILTELNAFWKELDSGKSPTLAPESRSVHHG